MHPSPALLCRGANLLRGIKSPGVYISGLNANDGSFGQARKPISTHSSLRVSFDRGQALCSKSRYAQSLQNRGVNFSPGDHFDRWRTEQTVFRNVPTRPFQQGVSCGKQRGKVRYRRATNQPARAIRGKSERLAGPLESDVLQLYSNRRHNAKRCVLVPCAGNPTCRQRRRDDSPIHKTEIAPARVGCRGWRTDVVQLPEHVRGAAWCSGKRFMKSRESSESGLTGAHWVVSDAVNKANCPVGDECIMATILSRRSGRPRARGNTSRDNATLAVARRMERAELSCYFLTTASSEAILPSRM